MTEYESNNLEGENLEEGEEQMDQEKDIKEYNNDNEEEEEQENETENNNNNNKVDLSQNENDNENYEEQENNISNNISSNKYKNNVQNNNTNTLKNENDHEKEDNIDESGENPEILYEEFFNYFLPPKKSTLNIKECKNAMRCLGLVVTEREIQDFLEIKEKTGKEKINLDDFKSVCNKKFNETSNNLAELEEAFEMLDPEKNGIVDSVVLRHQMKIFKPKITDEEINQILSEFGEDKNGNINYREYLRNIKS